MNKRKELQMQILQNYFFIHDKIATLKLVYDTFAELINPNFGDDKIEKLNDKLFCRTWNCIIYYREFDKLIVGFQSKEQTNRLIAIHGNRFLLHGIFQIYKQKLNQYQTYLETTDIDSTQLKKHIADLIDAVAQAKMDLYPDSYAANIFKNANKCRELEKKIDYIKF